LPGLQAGSTESDDVQLLFVKIDRIQYLLKRTGPQNQAEDHTGFSSLDPGQEISDTRRVLKTRFEKYQSSYLGFPGFNIHDLNDEQLKEFSSETVKTLRREHQRMPGITVRTRIFDLSETQNTSFSLPPPALQLADPPTATM